MARFFIIFFLISYFGLLMYFESMVRLRTLAGLNVDDTKVMESKNFVISSPPVSFSGVLTIGSPDNEKVETSASFLPWKKFFMGGYTRTTEWLPIISFRSVGKVPHKANLYTFCLPMPHISSGKQFCGRREGCENVLQTVSFFDLALHWAQSFAEFFNTLSSSWPKYLDHWGFFPKWCRSASNQVGTMNEWHMHTS